MFRSLSIRNYRIWFIGALISNIGGWMQATAQDWVVLTELTDNDATAVGITMALQFGPQLFLVPITGAFADRYDRKILLMWTQALFLGLAAGLGALLLFGQAELWHLYLFALGLGIVNAFDAPARQTYVSDLVGRENMSNAVALNSATFNSARLVGPAVAGVLIALIGSGWVFMINAATFVAMLIALLAIKTPRRVATSKDQRGSQLQELLAGLKYVLSRQDLVVIFVIVFFIGALGMNFPIFASTMAVEFGRGAGEYGLLSSTLAIGSLVGALIVAKRADARLRTVVSTGGTFGLAALGAALSPNFWTFAVVLVAFGYTTSVLLSTANAFVQTTTIDALRGRVMSLYFAIMMGSTLIGAPVVGAASDAWGPRWGLVIAAASGFVSCIIGMVWLFRVRKLRLHVGPRLRLSFTHVGRPGPRTGHEVETLTAPIAILGREVMLLPESNSLPQNGPIVEAVSGPIPTHEPLPEQGRED